MPKEIIIKLKEKLNENRKLALIIAVGFLGIMLISLSEVKNIKTEKNEETTTESVQLSVDEYTLSLEERLTDLLSSIEDAGQVKVMVTLKSSDESVYAVNENIKNDNDSNSYSNSFVIIENKSVKEGIKLKVLEPQVQGVAVVCSGGDNPIVISRIKEAITAVLGIGSNNVSVSKMK